MNVMKIILKAFGYLQSDIMEVPENTTPEFKLALNQPLQSLYSYNGETTGEITPIHTMATFIWSGNSEAVNCFIVREYVLKDIYKQ